MSYSLAFLLLCIFLSNAAGDSCAEGFMDLSLLESKAATPVGALADDTLAENTETRWIFSDNEFMCNNVKIKEIFIGADIRTEHGKRNEYPSIELWRLQWYWDIQLWKWIYYYSKVQSVPIELSPHNFTTNGLYHYIFPTPISFSSNNYYNSYRIGVYQPQDDKSVVRLYNGSVSNPITVGKIRLDSIDETDIRISDPDREIDLINDATEAFMVHLITGILACAHNYYRYFFIFCRP